MPVEFVAEPAPGPEPPHQPQAHDRRLVRGLSALGALGLVVLAAVVVLQSNGGGSHGAAQPSATPTPTPSPTSGRTLELPESVAFGPRSIDVEAAGSRVFSLTPTLIGIADRDSSAVTVRAAPVGLSNRDGDGRLMLDLDEHLVWAVDVGGTAVGGYSSDNLDKLVDLVMPHRIVDATAFDGQLYMTTDHGVYTVVAGPEPPQRLSRSHAAFGVIGADSEAHVVYAADRRGVLHAFAQVFPIARIRSPVTPVTSIVGTDGTIWLTGGGELERSRADLYIPPQASGSPFQAAVSVGPQTTIVASFGRRLLLRNGTAGAQVSCFDAADRTIRQTWRLAPGAVALNERGLLVTSASGIESRNARDCLAGR